jgi:hypothetical protein
VFTQFLLADEINRMPPRTQAALLESMEERQVTMDGEAHLLDDYFTVSRRRIHWSLRGRIRCQRRSLIAS